MLLMLKIFIKMLLVMTHDHFILKLGYEKKNHQQMIDVEFGLETIAKISENNSNMHQIHRFREHKVFAVG